MLNRPTKLRHIVTALIERGRDERPNFAVVHAVDGGLADLRIGSSATLLRNVAIIGDPEGVEAGMTVSLRWDDRPGYQSRPMVLAPGGGGRAGVTNQGGYPPDNLTIENSPYGLSVKKGGIGLQHLGFSPALEGHTHKDSLTAHGWQITADGILYSGATAIHPAGQIVLGLAPDIVKLDSRHPTYRIWAGDTDPAQAPFSVSKTGAVHATLGDIAGWNLTASEINSDNGAAAVNALTPHIRLGASAFDTGSGFWVGKEAGVYKLRIGDPSGSKLVWDGADLVLTGTIYAGGGEIGGWLIGTDKLTADTGAVGMGSGVDGWRFWAGHNDPSQAPFRVNNLGEAWLENANVAVTLQSQNYVAGVSGWYLDNNGYAEFGDVRVRGELVSTIFKYNEIQASAGTLGVFKSASTLSADLTTLAAPATFLVSVKNDDLGTSLFQAGDILRLKSWDGSVLTDNWLTIQAVPAPANQGSYTEYTCLLSNGTPGSFSSGTAVVDYGPSGYGSITLSADGGVGFSPNLTIATHAGTPWSAQTAHVRIGNLRGVLSIDTDQYGLAAGDLTPTSQNYIKAVGGQVEIKGQIAITGGSGIANLSDAGSLATQSSVDWGSEVGGAGKPADNATVGADWNSNLANIPTTLQSPGAAGLYLTSSYMGYWTGSAWSVYFRNNGYWKLTGGANYIEWNGTSLTIKGEGSGITNINGGNIQANTVTATQIAASTITATQLASNSVTAVKIAANAVTADKLNVSTLSAITASTGTLQIDTGGWIKLNGGTIYDYTTSGNTIYWSEATSGNKLYAYLASVYSGYANALQTMKFYNETSTAGKQVQMWIGSQKQGVSNIYAYHSTFFDVDTGVASAQMWGRGSGFSTGSGVTASQGDVTIDLQGTGYAVYLNQGAYQSYIGMQNASWLHYSSGAGSHYFYGNLAVASGLAVGATRKPATGDIEYTGSLRTNTTGSYLTGYIYVPLSAPITVQGAWGTKTGSNAGTLFTLTGVPANVKAVAARLAINGTSTNGSLMAFGPTSGDYQFGQICQGSYMIDQNGIINTNGTNQVYQMWNAQGGTIYWYLAIYGYYI